LSTAPFGHLPDGAARFLAFAVAFPYIVGTL
jgi:hypothetical protein